MMKSWFLAAITPVCHLILQKSFKCDFLLLSMLKAVVLPTIIVEAMIHFSGFFDECILAEENDKFQSKILLTHNF